MRVDHRPTGNGSLTARGAATRARIVDAAVRLVSVVGAGKTSLDKVLEASGTSKSQLYHYFADKDALMCAVIEAQADRVISFQAACLKGVRSLAGLRDWRDAVVELNRASGSLGGCPIGSLASELVDRSEHARTLLATSFLTWEDHLIASFNAMIQEGALEADVDPHDLATATMSALQGGLLLAQTTRSTRPLELALDMALEHVARHASARRTHVRKPKPHPR